MKQTAILFVSLLAFATTVYAQDNSQTPSGKWSTSSKPALKVSEFMFNNWSSSGNSQIDATATFFGNYKYTHAKFVWDNVADLAYGYSWQDLDNSYAKADGGLFETRRKSNDKIDLNSALSWQAYKKWGVNFSANLKTQFGNGYEYTGSGATQTETIVSGFFAPAYLTTALSFEHKRDNWMVSLSFLTGKTTFVFNDSLIAAGKTYGVIQDDNPATFTHSYFALGSYVKAMYLKKNILPNFDLYARIELFYDYNKPKNLNWDNMDTKSSYTPVGDETITSLMNYGWLHRRAFETDLDFELKVDYRLSSHISANLAINLKWDTDFSGMGRWGHWQVYQMAGLQIFFDI